MNWYLDALKQYATFAGRARRTAFWMFVLINFIISTVLSILWRATDVGILEVIYYLYALAVLIPGIAVTVRRLHDTGRSGGWWWIGLIPIVGWIILIVFCAQDSQPGPNKYGPNPKQIDAGPEPAWPGYPPVQQPYPPAQPPYPQGQGYSPYPQGQPPYPQGQAFPQQQGQPPYPQGQAYPQQGQPPYPGQ